MSPSPLRTAALLSLAGLLLISHSAAAAGWRAAEPVSPPAGPDQGVLATDLAADGDGRVTAAYQWCGESDPQDLGLSLSCSIKAVTRSAATGNWGGAQTLRPAGAAITRGPAWVEVVSNTAGDTAVLWEECDGYSPMICVPWVAMRPRGRSVWTAATPVVPHDAVNSADSNNAAAIVLDEEGTATVTWSRRHWAPPNRPHDLRVRSFGIDDPDAATPTLDFEPAQTLNPVDPGNSGTDQATASTVVALDDGTTVAAWWYYSGACSTVRYSVRPLGGSWSAAQGIRPDGCSDAARLDLVELAMIADGAQAVLVYSAEVDPDPEEVPASYAKTFATTISATGLVGEHTVLSHRRLGLAGDQSSGSGDTWQAGLARNASGVIALGAFEASPTTNAARPVVIMRSAAGAWGAAQSLGDEIGYNATLPWAPGVTVAADGTATAAWGVDLGDKSESPFNYDHAILAAQVTPGGTPSAPVRVSPPARRSQAPLVAAGSGGTPVIVWRAEDLVDDDKEVLIGSTDADGSTSQAPVASFTWSPDRPQAGQLVTFTSTSTDADGPITSWAWDFDGDGDFDDASGEQTTAVFEAAGTYPVELRVSDGDDHTDHALNVVVVDAPSPVAPAPTPDRTPTPNPDVHVPAPPAEEAPKGFVVRSTVDTNGQRVVPAVAGRPLDDARERIERALVYADTKVERVVSDADKLGRRPGGGKWKVGDVVSQTPAARARVAGSASAPARVVLRYWAGAKSDRSRCDQLRSTLKQDELDLALAQLKAAGCGTPDLRLKSSSKVDEPTVKSLSKDLEDLVVTIPSDQAKTDIVIWKNTGFLGTADPGPVPSANGDLQLTAGQRNVAGIVVRDRAGRALNRASVTWDLSGVGGGEVTSKSIESGVAPIKLTPTKAGTIRVLVQWSDASGDSIYGSTEFTVVDRSKQTGFVTAIGQSFKRTGSGSAATFVPGTVKKRGSARYQETAQRIGIGDFFGLVAQCVRAWGGAVAAAVQPSPDGILAIAKKHQVSVAQLWRGPVTKAPQAVNPQTVAGGLWLVRGNGVVSAGGGNVVAAGGMNVIAAGGANVVSAGGLNVIAAGGGNVVSAGGGNIITLPDGARVVAAGGANVVAAGGANVVAAGGANVVAAGGLN